VNAMIKAIVKDANALGTSKIVLGKLKGIRGNSHNCKANSMINNFWSFNYVVGRFKEKAEEHGIEVKEESERETSSVCPTCRSRNTASKGRLFKCLSCGLEAHRDAVGVLNIARLHGGEVNGAVAHPLLLRWNGVMWKPKRAMNNRADENLRSKNLPASAVGSVKCLDTTFTCN
ncbi:MAG: transposase, partial [Thermoproteota archaeon]